MGKDLVPSLFSLCVEAVTSQIIIHGDADDDDDQHLLNSIFELPPDLFGCLLMGLPPVALHKVQLQISSAHGGGPVYSAINNGRKRERYGDFNIAWKTLYKSRWPEGVGQSQPVKQLLEQGTVGPILVSQSGDWGQMYWEAHLQNCLDRAAEQAVLPSFYGCIGEIRIPGAIMKSIGYGRCTCDTTCVYSKLSYHCQQYGCYARYLRLQNVLCVSETCDLLKESKLHSMVIRRLRVKLHVDGACKILSQNSETLSSLELIHCQLSSTALDAICNSLFTKDSQMHGIQNFSIKASTVGEQVSFPSGLLSFFSSGRSLCSLTFCDNHLGPNCAKMVFSTFLDASSGLSVLDLSENDIAGWLSYFNRGFSRYFPPASGVGNSIQSLRVLKLRGCNLHKDDADDLRYLLVEMPYLETLDISENLIEDSGLRNLIPYFTEATERNFPLLDVKMDNCNLSCSGVTEVLKSLSHLKQLHTLSIADNDLGNQVAVPLAKFLAESCARVLNIEDIALGSSGFLELRREMPEAVKLMNINISKNRGGFETANFVYELILRAPELVALNAGYNFMPSESLAVVCSALKVSKGKLKQVDLTGNTGCYQPAHASVFTEFQIHGRPILLLPLSRTSAAPYDDDP